MGFVFQSLLIGIGLAMDAFSVSLVSGLSEPKMKLSKMAGVAAVFGAFQGVMPLLGWICVHTLVTYFTAFTPFIPWIAFFLLAFLGGKTLWEGIREKSDEACPDSESVEKTIGIGFLLLQGVATSIDALSVGFTIADYDFLKALYAVQIIAVVTFIVCFAGVFLGKEFGTRLAGKASILGGTILVGVGVYLLLNHLFFS